MRLRGTALFIEGVERGLAAAITPIVMPKNLSSGSPEDRELSLSACAWRSAKKHEQNAPPRRGQSEARIGGH